MTCDDHHHQDHLEDDLPGRDVPGGHQHPPAPLLEVNVVVESHDDEFQEYHRQDTTHKLLVLRQTATLLF